MNISSINTYPQFTNLQSSQKLQISNDIIPINSLGRIGVYSKNQIFSYRDLVITSGVLTFNQVKNQTLAELRTFKFSRHEMDFVNNTVK